MTRRPRRSLAKRGGFALVACAAGLWALEGTAWLWERANPLHALPLPGPGSAQCIPECLPGLSPYPEVLEAPGLRMVYDDERAWWVALPDSASLAPNSLGLRGPELGPKLENELRILTLGDSTIWGHGVKDEDVFSTVAAEVLSERWGRPVRAVIGAQPGHDVEQSGRVLASRGRAIEPDWVLIGNQWSDMFYDEPPPQIRAPGQSAPFALYRISHRLMGRFLSTETVGWLDPERGVGTPKEGAQPRTPLPAYRDGLTNLARRAQEELGARVAFIVLPAPIDWHAEGLPRFVSAYRDTLRSVAAERNAPVVEGAQWFESHGASNAHFYDPVHPSVEGHRLLSEALVATLDGPEGLSTSPEQ